MAMTINFLVVSSVFKTISQADYSAFSFTKDVIIYFHLEEDWQIQQWQKPLELSTIPSHVGKYVTKLISNALLTVSGESQIRIFFSYHVESFLNFLNSRRDLISIWKLEWNCMI